MYIHVRSHSQVAQRIAAIVPGAATEVVVVQDVTLIKSADQLIKCNLIPKMGYLGWDISYSWSGY